MFFFSYYLLYAVTYIFLWKYLNNYSKAQGSIIEDIPLGPIINTDSI